MSQTLQNQATISKSMNGIISVSDGIILMENGSITNVDTLQADTMNTGNLQVDNINVADTITANIIDASNISITDTITANIIDASNISITDTITANIIDASNIITDTFSTTNLDLTNGYINYTGDLSFNAVDGKGIFSENGAFISGFAIQNCQDISFGQYKTISFDGDLTITSLQGGDIFSSGGYALSGFALDNIGGLTMGSLQPLNMTSGSITGIGDMAFGQDSLIEFDGASLTINSLQGGDLMCGGGYAMVGFAFDECEGLNMKNLAELNMNSGIINNCTDINFEAGSSALITSQNNTTLQTTGTIFLNAENGIDCNYQSISNVFEITADLYNYKGFINFGKIQTVLGGQLNYTLTFPLPSIVNILGTSGITNIFLPDLDGMAQDQGSVITFMRSQNEKVVILNAYSPQTIKKMDNSLSTTFTFDNPINNSISFFYNKTLNVKRWIQITPLESVDVGSIYSINTFTAKNTFTADLEVINSKAYMENLTFSNLSTDITITNWDASNPAVSTNSYLQLYTGTGVYTGVGYETSLVSGSNYTLIIQNGSTFPFYNDNNNPIASNQAFILQVPSNARMKFKTIAYTLQAGTYVFGWYLESKDNGSGGLPIVVSAVDNLTNLPIGVSSPPINSATAFPNWVFTTITFNLEVQTSVRFEFINELISYVNGGWVALTGLELTYSGSILITDTITGKDATISGSVSLLNNLSVNDGLDVASGGLSVVGGITTTTTYGLANTTINTSFGALVDSSNSSLNVALGDGALQSGTNADKNVIIGVSCNTGATTIKDMVCIGYNVNSGATEERSIIIGSNQMSKGSSLSNNIIIGYKSFPVYKGTARSACIAIGTDALGGLRSNIYNAFSSDYCVAVGTEALANSVDFYNTAIGFRSLYNILGTNDIEEEGDKTQYNTALGYQAGLDGFFYNKCTFLGASTDANTNYIENSTAVGYNSIITQSNQIVLGGNDGANNFPVVLLPNKNTLYSCQNKSSNFTLVLGSQENIIITDPAVNAITLPTISLASSIGASFTFKKAYVSAGLTSITITAGASQNIIANNATANTYSFTSSRSYLKLTCIATSGNVWAVVSIEGGTGGGGSQSLSDVLAVGNDMTTYSIVANGATISPTEISYLDNVSSNIQTQLNGKTTLAGVQANANIFSAIQRFNEGVRMEPLFVGLTGNVNYSSTTSFLGKKLYISSNTSATNIITLPAIVASTNFTLDIHNLSNTACIISSTANIRGQYGTNATTMTLHGGVILKMISNGTNWLVNEYSGIAQQVIYRNTGNLLLPSGSLSPATINTINNVSWGSSTLNYSSGYWMNETGFDMTLSLSATYTWNAKANSTTIEGGGLNANGARSVWLLHSNTTNYPKFIGTNNLNTTYTSTNGNNQNLFLFTTITYQSVNTTFLLKNGENFRLILFHTNTINNAGGTGVYLVSTSQLDAVNITLSRLN